MLENRNLILIIVLGVVVFLAGFAYDAMFAGIPYQDPTAEMAARYARHAKIAATVMVVGGGTLLLGLAGCVFRWLCGRDTSDKGTP